MSTNEERSTEVTRSAPAGTTGETPADAQPRKKRVSVELPPPVEPLPGQTAIPGSGVGDIIKRRPGRPRGKTMPEDEREMLRRLDQGEFGPVGTGFPPATPEQITADERATARERKRTATLAAGNAGFTALDWINLRYMAENLLRNCQEKDEFETRRVLGIIAGVTRHMGLPHA